MIKIKKVVILLLSILLLTGCGNMRSDSLKNFKDYNAKIKSYELKGTMKLRSNEDEFTYDVSVNVMDEEYYKVSLLNTINNHEQVILKNKDGVYVVTPNMNKSFKFQSEWPKNSSQAYLIESLVNDVNKDSEAKISKVSDGYEIETKVNYPNNNALVKEIIKTDEKFNVKKIKVLNKENTALIEFDINSLDKKKRFTIDNFNLDNNVKINENSTNKQSNTSTNTTTTTTQSGTTAESTTSVTTKPTECISEDCNENETSSILEDIVYPLYVPVDTYLESKDTVTTDKGNRIILTFAGVDPFVLVEEKVSKNEELEIIPVNGEPILLSCGVASLTDNSIYFTSGDVDFYLTSKTIEPSEMMMIAESIQNSTNAVASTK